MNVMLPSGGDSVGIGVTDSAFSCGVIRPADAEAEHPRKGRVMKSENRDYDYVIKSNSLNSEYFQLNRIFMDTTTDDHIKMLIIGSCMYVLFAYALSNNGLLTDVHEHSLNP